MGCMTNLGGIQLAIELATKHRDACQKQMAMFERHVAACEAQMQQLRSYAEDKDNAWLSSGPLRMSAELIRHHYQFVDRLQQAIAMQIDVLAQSSAQLHSAQKALTAAEVRLEGLNRILARRVSARTLLTAKREQKQTDEFAAQRFVSNKELSSKEQYDGH